MKRCSKCIIPETYPGISFTADGVCNLCVSARSEATAEAFSEQEFRDRLGRLRSNAGKYDCVISLSGGVDSSATFINLIEKYGVRPLAWHCETGFENPIASRNVRKLCKAYDVDLVIQHDMRFMTKLFRYINAARTPGIGGCWACGLVMLTSGIEVARRVDAPISINGYNKGQVAYIEEKTRDIEEFRRIGKLVASTQDADFIAAFQQRYEYLRRMKVVTQPSDLAPNDEGQTLVLPFFNLPFNRFDKAGLRELCRKRFDWEVLDGSYPRRSSNCQMAKLNVYMELDTCGYSLYDQEYAALVRRGELSRQQALEDLDFNCPTGTTQELADQIGLDVRVRDLTGSHLA